MTTIRSLRRNRSAIVVSALFVLGLSACSDQPKTASDYLVATELVAHANASIEARIYAIEAGEGEWVTLLPGLGRSTADFTEEFGSTLTTDLVEAGHRVVLIEPRGFGGSTGSLESFTMHDLADDLKAVFDDLGISNVHMVGHGFGNRLSRTFASVYPDYVDDVTLLGAGGDFEPTDEQVAVLTDAVNPYIEPDVRLDAIDTLLFAEGNDPSIYFDGWDFPLAWAQGAALETVDSDFYKAAAGKDMLIVQPLEDYIAPPDLAGRALAEDLGEQVTLVEIEGAGHALLPEQPEAVTAALLEFYAR